MKKRGYKDALRGVENARIEAIIDAYVHSQRDRKVLKLSMIHDISYTRISQRMDLQVSSRTVQSIMNRWAPVILDHL